MKLTIFAKSSSGGSYPVEFVKDEAAIRVFCHCQAGVLQQMCKHKLALIKLDSRMLFDPAQQDALDGLQGWPAYPALKARLVEYERDLPEIEREKTSIAQREKALKAALAYELAHGKPRG